MRGYERHGGACPRHDGWDASGFEQNAGLTGDLAAARRASAQVLIPRRVVEHDAVAVRRQSAVVFEREVREATLGRSLVDRLQALLREHCPRRRLWLVAVPQVLERTVGGVHQSLHLLPG